MSAGPTWTLRGLRGSDESALGELYRRALGRSVDPALRRWKLEQRPSPVENVWLAVDQDERPIFHYAGIPCRLQLPDGERQVMVSVDAMTDPDFRRQGLLSHCAAQIFESWRQAGVALTLGLPNEQWGSRTAALGWRPLFPLRWQVRLLRPEKRLARALRVPGLARLRVASRLWNLAWRRPWRRDPGLVIEELQHAGDELDELDRACRAGGRVSIVRGQDWVRWRYLEHPSHGYRVLAARRAGRLEGYLVYRIEDTPAQRVAYVAELDWAGADPRVAGSLLEEAVRLFLADEVVAAFTLAVPGSELYQAGRRAGFIFGHGSFQVHCVPLADQLDLDLLRDPRRWHLSGGDFDVI